MCTATFANHCIHQLSTSNWIIAEPHAKLIRKAGFGSIGSICEKVGRGEIPGSVCCRLRGSRIDRCFLAFPRFRISVGHPPHTALSESRVPRTQRQSSCYLRVGTRGIVGWVISLFRSSCTSHHPVCATCAVQPRFVFWVKTGAAVALKNNGNKRGTPARVLAQGSHGHGGHVSQNVVSSYRGRRMLRTSVYTGFNGFWSDTLVAAWWTYCQVHAWFLPGPQRNRSTLLASIVNRLRNYVASSTVCWIAGCEMR